jgi:hypothetical protein
MHFSCHRKRDSSIQSGVARQSDAWKKKADISFQERGSSRSSDAEDLRPIAM